jgi:hypothetical protein
MHRQVKRDQVRAGEEIGIGRLAGNVQKRDGMTIRSQPGGRRCQPEGLPAKFISRDENDPQTSYYPPGPA